MRFLIISHAIHKKSDGKLLSYAPYVREMNLWIKYVGSVEIIAPSEKEEPSSIDLEYQHHSIIFNKIPALNFMRPKKMFLSIVSMPLVFSKLIGACKRADHIHLRCPGNIGLLGCFVQVFFPKKIKTAKYAGNWDPNSKQPLSYRIQKRILSSTVFTKNMTVLVYGKWKRQSKNIRSFYTATFHDSEKEQYAEKSYLQDLKFVFIGSLVKGKRPLLAIQIVEALRKKGKIVALDLYGDGALREELTCYIHTNNLKSYIELHGNQPKEIIKQILKKSHFTVLPSLSEGWPKAIVEGMFFGVIPIATKISCLPWMLDNGNRGILIEPDLEIAVERIVNAINNEDLNDMAAQAQFWSQSYTLDKFNKDIRKLLIK